MSSSGRALFYVAVGAIGGAVSALAFYKSFHRYRNDSSTEDASGDVSISNKIVQYPIEIQDELFSRVRAFFGDTEYTNLEQSFVIVVGLGGVGSHAANMLVRSGVRRIRLIDFDQVTLSSLNRHAVATMEDVGLSKAEVMRNKLLKVVPWCTIEAETEMFKKESAFRLLDGNPSIVLDCIDDVSTKAELIAHCMKNNIKVVIRPRTKIKFVPYLFTTVLLYRNLQSEYVTSIGAIYHSSVSLLTKSSMRCLIFYL